MNKFKKRLLYILVFFLLYYILYNFIIYKIKKNILENTPFITQLYSVYMTFYERYNYIPKQNELINFISDSEYENLKSRLNFFRCNMIISEDYYCLYEFGFNQKDDSLKPYISEIKDYKFINMLLHKREDILLLKTPTKEKLKKDKMRQEGIELPKVLPPPKLK